MKILKIQKKRLDQFAARLPKGWEIHAPVRLNGSFAFGRLESWSGARLDYRRTILPPKKYFLPPRESLFRFDETRGYEPVRDDPDRRIVLFGVHPCDIHALNILDKVFDGKYPDPYYQTRRQKIVIIGVGCMPDEHCFCRSMRADFVDQGFDLFFSDLGEDYLAAVGTSIGDDMVLAAASLFEPLTEADIQIYKRQSSEKYRAFTLDTEIRDLPEIVDMEYRNELWDELGRKCLSCGSCSMVCPTCYCYDVEDRVELGRTAGERLRSWDSCLFHTHALVAGGENFRGNRSSRIKFRFYHKQRGFVTEFGRPSCVGCGRCIAACPVGIDIVQIINRLRGEQDAVFE